MADFYDGLIRADQDFLAQFLATARHTNIFTQIARTIQGKFTNQDEYQKAIDGEKEKLKSKYSHEQLFWMAIFELNKILNIPPRRYQTEEDVKHNCREIEMMIVRVYNEQKDPHEPPIHSYDQFLGKMTQKLFHSLFKELKNVNWDELDAAKQDEVIARLKEFINEKLPDDQRRKIMEALNLSSLSEDELRTAIRRGGLWAVFSTIVNVAGFGFYAGVLAMIAGVMSILGISLPFAVFAGITALIAVVAAPVFLLFLLGWQAVKIGRANRSLPREIAMMYLMLITSLRNDETKKPYDIQLFISYYRDALSRADKVRHSLYELEIKRGDTERHIRQLSERIRSLNHHIYNRDVEQSDLITLITDAMANQNSDGPLVNYPEYKDEFLSMVAEREAYYEENRKETLKGNIFDKAFQIGKNIVKDVSLRSERNLS